MARKSQTLQIAQTEGLERVVAAEVSRLLIITPPWIVLAMLAGLGAISHHAWGEPPSVMWATLGSATGTFTLTLLTWAVTHQRGMIGRCHSTATILFAGLWFTVATITGVTAQVTLGLLFFGGLTLGVGWNIRAVIRMSPLGESGGGDALGDLFDRAKASFGLGGARVRTRDVNDHKIAAKMALPAGEKVVDDVVKRTEYIESGLKLPPGSVQVAADGDDASQANVTITDPRIMNKPIPWPGPSRPGGSIAEPSRVGVYQDAEPTEFNVTGSSLQIMGASGSGKSMGGGWNVLAEAVSRRDVAVFGVDLAKDAQTFGPLLPALHGLATTKATASRFIRALHAEIPQRTKWLAARGYNDWEPGCGLIYWLVVFEEVAKCFDMLGTADQEKIEQITKEIRSAGGRVIMSLQKSIFSEMPTIVRSQMAFMCFGVVDSGDGQYGLSEAQQRAECSPELWGGGKPEHQGKCFLDARGVPETHIAMPLRTYAWGSNPRQAVANMSAYAAQWPASAKPADEFTARLAALFGTPTGPSSPIPMPAAGAAQSDAQPAEPFTGTATLDDDQEDPSGEVSGGAVEEDLLASAVHFVVAAQLASTSMLQRKLRIGHADALRIMEVLQRRGIVGPPQVEGNRRVLVSAEEADACAEALREDGDAVAACLRTQDPSPEITAGPDDPIPETGDDRLMTDDKPLTRMSPVAARGLVYAWLRHRQESGEESFEAGHEDLQKIRTTSGMVSRGWIYKVLNGLVDQGVLDRDDDGPNAVFRVVSLEALDDVEREEV